MAGSLAMASFFFFFLGRGDVHLFPQMMLFLFGIQRGRHNYVNFTDEETGTQRRLSI